MDYGGRLVSRLCYALFSIRMSTNYGMDILFGGYGSFIWGVWYFCLGDMVFLFGGYGSFIWWVWYLYLGCMVLVFGGHGSFIWWIMGGD